MMRNRARLESQISSTKPNFGNTLKKMINVDQEEVENLQNWQHKNHNLFPKVIQDQEFKQKCLDPIEVQSNKGFEILLKDPIFKYSKIITDPRKLSERFNRNKKEKRLEEKKEHKREDRQKSSLRSSQSQKSSIPLESIASISSTHWNSSIGFERAEDIDYLEISKAEVAMMTKKMLLLKSDLNLRNKN